MVRRAVRGLPLVLVPLLATVFGCILLGHADEPEKTGVFDQEEYDWYWSTAVTNLDGLLARFDAQRWESLPIHPPGDTQFWQTGSPFPLPVDLAAFPEDFAKGLVGVDYGGFHLYPVYVVEDEETRALFLLNADSEPLGTVAAPEGYDWRDKFKDRLPWCFPEGMSPEEEQARFAELDPARLGSFQRPLAHPLGRRQRLLASVIDRGSERSRTAPPVR